MEIRRVRPEEWQAHRDIRLRALQSDPDAFGVTLEEALAEDDAAWQRRTQRPDGMASPPLTTVCSSGWRMAAPPQIILNSRPSTGCGSRRRLADRASGARSSTRSR